MPASAFFLAAAIAAAAVSHPSSPKAPPKAEASAASAKTSDPLAHDSPDQVRAKLGAPDIEHAEGQGALWTYRLEHCALLVAFKTGPKGLRVIDAFAGVRKRGETPLTLNACVAEGEQRRRAVETDRP
ncbi:MAG: hypothetical protein AB1429_03840 [Pseudomonadota bacterium]|jgi:hypothetical protein